MLGQIFCTAALVLSVLAAPRPLQDCSFHSAEPCKCPSGTTFQSSTTYAVIGAAAKDVKDITFDCKQSLLRHPRQWRKSCVG